MRVAIIALSASILAVAAFSAFAQKADAETKFKERAARVNATVADDMAKLGVDCLKWGLNVAGVEHLQHALEINEANERAHKALGHDRKPAVDKITWEPNPKKAPPAEDAADIKAEARAAYASARNKVFKEASREFASLGQFAAGLELADYARAAFEAALRYNPENEDAMKASGWAREGAFWLHPREIALREVTARALAEPPESAALEKLPEWAAGLGNQARPVSGIKAGELQVFGSGGLHREVLRQAAAVRTLAVFALGGESGELRVFLSESKTQHEAYAAARHPESPGIGKEPILLRDNEFAVLRDENEKLTVERIVFAAARSEVRARCGSSGGLWLELGFASDMTRRLCASVALTPISSKEPGPADSTRWKSALVTLIEAGKQPALEKMLVDRDPGEPAIMMAHFFTRYLVQQHGPAMAAFCGAVKGGESMEAALKSATLIDPAKLERAFLPWVKRQP